MSGLVLERRPKRAQILGAVAGAAVAVATLLVVAMATHVSIGHGSGSTARPPPQVQTPLVSAAGLAERSGVRLTQVAVTGAGGLIDLRYQVVDPDRANSLHNPRTPPFLVLESTGLLVNELLMGHSHKGRLKAGQTYYLIFENPGNLVHRGARVTVQLGDAHIGRIRVR